MKSSLVTALAMACALSLGACCNNKSSASSAAACPAGGTDAVGASNPDQVVATFGDEKLTMGEVDKLIAKDVFAMRQQAIEATVLTRLIEKEAKAAGKEPEDFLRGIAESAEAAPIPEDQLKAMYEQLKPRLGDKSFEETKPMLEQMLKQEGQKKAVMDYIEGLKKKANVKILLEEPKVEVKADGPAMGPVDAPVTIITFSDFECPYCARAAQTMHKLVNNNAGKIRLVFRSYPLPFHKNAKKASEAALCANEQGKFWEMHDKLFESTEAKTPLTREEFGKLASALGLDMAAFDTCLDSGKFGAQIEEDMKIGQQAGVEGTPAFFINGRFVSGARPLEDFQTIVDQELAKK
ncbi:MAG: DsbA family protein [Myxococcales bacterium]|jgi:protein-disulfide isomerase|nr:DsbA family protein [Myxococcales bacterium]